jgi:hypothetical protein
MSSHRLSETAVRSRLGSSRLDSAQNPPAARRVRLRRILLGAIGLLGAATLLAACGDPWTAPESTVREPTTTTPALTPVPGGGGSLTVTNPLAFQTQSPGRAIPAQNNSRINRPVSHRANHNYY